MKRIGFFGGTFDPIHFGHLNLLIYMLENEGLDHIFVCPTGLSPFKQTKRPISSFSHRINMLRLALKDISNISILDIERDESKPSYTIDSIRWLTTKFPQSRFNLIITQDILSDIAEWKDIENLFELSPPLIGGRGLSYDMPPTFAEILKKGFRKTPIMEISSTNIRERLKKRLYCGHLLPKEVLDYIEANKLY